MKLPVSGTVAILRERLINKINENRNVEADIELDSPPCSFENYDESSQSTPQNQTAQSETQNQSSQPEPKISQMKESKLDFMDLVDQFDSSHEFDKKNSESDGKKDSPLDIIDLVDSHTDTRANQSDGEDNTTNNNTIVLRIIKYSAKKYRFLTNQTLYYLKGLNLTSAEDVKQI